MASYLPRVSYITPKWEHRAKCVIKVIKLLVQKDKSESQEYTLTSVPRSEQNALLGYKGS